MAGSYEGQTGRALRRSHLEGCRVYRINRELKSGGTRRAEPDSRDSVQISPD